MRLKPNQVAHGLRSVETCNPSSSGGSQLRSADFLSNRLVFSTIPTMNDDRKNNRPRRVAKSHPVEVEISDLTFDDVTKASSLKNDGRDQSASTPNPRSDSNYTDHIGSATTTAYGATQTDILASNGGPASNLVGEHQFDFSKPPTRQSLQMSGGVSSTPSIKETLNAVRSSNGGPASNLVGEHQFDFSKPPTRQSLQMSGGVSSTPSIKETLNAVRSSSDDLDSEGPASLDSANGPQDGVKVQSTDGEAEIRLTGWRAGSVLGWSCFKGIVWGVIWMLLFVLVSLAMDKMGILDAVNSLMGEAMHFDLGKMVKLSVVAGVVLGMFVVLLNFFNMMFLNAYATLIGPLKAKVYIVRRKNGLIDAPVDPQVPVK